MLESLRALPHCPPAPRVLAPRLWAPRAVPCPVLTPDLPGFQTHLAHTHRCWSPRETVSTCRNPPSSLRPAQGPRAVGMTEPCVGAISPHRRDLSPRATTPHPLGDGDRQAHAGPPGEELGAETPEREFKFMKGGARPAFTEWRGSHCNGLGEMCSLESGDPTNLLPATAHPCTHPPPNNRHTSPHEPIQSPFPASGPAPTTCSQCRGQR